MRRWRLALAAFVSACGGSPATVAPTVPVAPPSASAAAPPPAQPAPDVSPVPAPQGLAFTAHLAHPRRTVEQLTSALGSLAALLGAGSKLDPASLVTMAAGAPVGALVDLDQPLDLAVSDVNGGGEVRVAGAAVLADPAAARETLERYYRWTPTGPGVVRLEPRDDAPDDASPRPCMLAAAYAPAGAATRLVCGVDERSVRHLGAYLARTMPRVASSDDLRLELFVRALRDRTPHTPDDAKSADPIDRTLDELGDKLVDDVGSLVLEASSDGATVDVKLASAFTSASSPATRAMLGIGPAAAAPSPLFERLPRDASIAWFGRGASPADHAPLQSLLLDALRGSMLDDGFAEAAADTLTRIFRPVLLTGGPWALAAGHRTDAARAALDTWDAGPRTAAARARARAAMQGWVVLGVEEPAATWMQAVRDLVKADALAPTRKPRTQREPPERHLAPAIVPVASALQLPGGTLHVEVRVTANPAWIAAQRKAKKKVLDPILPHSIHLLVVPDGARTWLAVGEDAALVASEVRASLAGAPDTGTLHARSDLDALRALPASVAGYLSVTGLAMWAAGDSTDDGLHKAHETLRGLAALTNAGATPVPFAFSASPKAGGPGEGGDVRMRVLFPIQLGLEVATSPHPIF